MLSDDRKRSFENALASHLRAGTKGTPNPECSDAETLAAYHEGSLPAEQTASLKAHLLECDRCQEILAQLQATDEIAAPVVGVPQQAAQVVHPVNPASINVRILTARRPTLWRWVAPASALAAALLIWVSVHQNNSLIVPIKTPSPTPSLDANQPQSAAVRSLTPSLPAASPSGDSAQNKPDSIETKIGAAPRELSEELSKQKGSAKKESTVTVPLGQMDSSGRTAESQRKARNELSRIEAARTGAGEKAEMEDKVQNGRRDGILPELALPQSVPSPPVPSPEVHRRAQAATEPPGAAGAAVSAGAVSGGFVQQQEMDGRSRFKSADIRLAKSISESTIAAPGGRVAWRIGEAGVIEFSSDAGKTWTVQPSGVIADLLAGSAPSDKVCWIVGRSGMILRTTDGGASWQKLNAPTQGDLLFVFALDARQATVSLPNASYQTKDGGVTWNKLAPE